jgi:hypothetical protein
MGKQLGAGAVIAVMAVVVVVLGLVAWRFFGAPAGGSAQNIQQQVERDMMQMQRGGRVPPGGGMPGPR